MPIDDDFSTATISPRLSSSDTSSEYSDIELKDLKVEATLGAGAFGRVELVSHPSGNSFALKKVKISNIIKEDQKEHIISEKKVMTMCQNSLFIVE